MLTITSLNEKGGVGKTTLSVTLACGLAAKGYRALLLDTDPQGHCARYLGQDKAPDFYDLMLRPQTQWKDILVSFRPDIHGGEGQLHLVRSNVETGAIPLVLDIRDSNRLAKRLEQLEDLIDFTIIDTSPTPGNLAVIAQYASDYVLIPTKAEILSFDGLVETLGHITDDVRLLGIVPTMVRNTLEHNENLAALEKRYPGKILCAIGESTVWAESATANQPVFVYAPQEKAAQQALQFVDEVLKRANHG